MLIKTHIPPYEFFLRKYRKLRQVIERNKKTSRTVSGNRFSELLLKTEDYLRKNGCTQITSFLWDSDGCIIEVMHAETIPNHRNMLQMCYHLKRNK